MDESFRKVFEYMDENIVPKLERGIYKDNNPQSYYELGNYKNDKIEEIKKNELKNNYLPQKFITFIIPLKNRNERFNIQLKNLIKVIDFNRVDIIVVEDEFISSESEYYNHNINMNILPDEIRDKIRYYRVRTGVNWSRSKLMNYGIAKTTTMLFMGCDVDFIFHEKFMERLEQCCMQIDFNKYCLGISVWESHDSYWDDAHTNILRYAYEPYGACYIFLTEGIKYIGGFDTSIINHGTEDVELKKRLFANGCETIYGHILYPKLYVIHYSHDNSTRGEGHTYEEFKDIFYKNDKRIPFIYELETINM